KSLQVTVAFATVAFASSGACAEAVGIWTSAHSDAKARVTNADAAATRTTRPARGAAGAPAGVAGGGSNLPVSGTTRRTAADREESRTSRPRTPPRSASGRA